MTESAITIREASAAFLTHLQQIGKKERTIYTYRKDLEQVEQFFGSDRKLSELKVPYVGKFYKSDILLKLPDGRERAERTVAKTVRVFRMMLTWAKEQGHIEIIPLPKCMQLTGGQATESDDVEQQS